jgi:hypothetical protein
MAVQAVQAVMGVHNKEVMGAHKEDMVVSKAATVDHPSSSMEDSNRVVTVASREDILLSSKVVMANDLPSKAATLHSKVVAILLSRAAVGMVLHHHQGIDSYK